MMTGAFSPSLIVRVAHCPGAQLYRSSIKR
jgi:hypothetical protein